MRIPEPVRELRPHATWRALELLWALVEATVLAALYALWQYFKTHLDLLSILTVFAASSTVLLIGSVRRRQRGLLPLQAPIAPKQASIAGDVAALNPLEESLKQAKQERDEAKRSIDDLQRELWSCKQREEANTRITTELELLKERARIIKRQWPETAFCYRPFRRDWWTPGSTQWHIAPWFNAASQWHDEFRNCSSRLLPMIDELYLRSLSLYEVIELLDRVQIERTIPGCLRSLQVSPMFDPVLKIDEWGCPNSGESVSKCGFRYHNEGSAIASNVHLPVAAAGAAFIGANADPMVKLAKTHKGFIVARLASPYGVVLDGSPIVRNLEELIRMPADASSGVPHPGFLFCLAYESDETPGRLRKYVSRHEVILDGAGIAVNYINTELVSTLS